MTRAAVLLALALSACAMLPIRRMPACDRAHDLAEYRPDAQHTWVCKPAPGENVLHATRYQWQLVYGPVEKK